MFNFEEVKKTKGVAKIPNGILRLYSDHFAISADAAGSFQSTRSKSRDDFRIGTIRLGFAYDPNNKAIKIKSDENGFACNFYESGTVTGRTPSSLREQAPVGDYKLVDGQRDIFQLVI